MGIKILVTGATGFVGSRLCKTLESKGFEVFRHTSGISNIAENEALNSFLEKEINHVFHCAANTFVPESWNSPLEFIRTNVQGTATVLEFCRNTRASYTYISAYVYGADVPNPISEAFTPAPNNPYALSKRMGEEVCEFYSRHYNLNGTVVRPFNIYGPGQPSHFLIPFIIGQIKNGAQVRVKDLTPKRDYIFIDDLIDFLVKTMSPTGFQILNAGTGKSYSVEEVIKMLLEISGKNLEVFSEGEIRKNEISDTIASIKLAKETINWEPHTDIKEGLRKSFLGS